MRYFLAIILPPVAALLCGKPFQALLNLILTLLGWIPGVVHALFIVHTHLADKRNKNLIDAIEKDSSKRSIFKDQDN
ncbi:YqaE/Pmp3 family membrane protein [Endozoicomonadaceae bacterium StTr2]